MSLRETLQRIRRAATPPNEEAAKFQIITPILRDLGWDPFGSVEVRYEHRVELARGGGYVDIALMGERHTVAHVEAKAPGKDLSRHVQQVLGYAFQEGVQVCALTDGLEWRLYLPREAGPPDQRLFATLRLQHDPLEELVEDLHMFLGKDNLWSGRAERRAREVLVAVRDDERVRTELPKIWRRMVDGADKRLVDLVIGEAYEELGLRPRPEQVMAVLRGLAVPQTRAASRSGQNADDTPVKNEEPPRPSSPPPPSSPPSPPPPRRRVAGKKPAAYVLWGNRHEVRTWKQILIGVAEGLYQRHGPQFDRILELRGRKHPYASRHKEDFRFASAPVADSGLHIDAHMSAVQIRRRSRELLEHFGHSPDDLEIETREN